MVKAQCFESYGVCLCGFTVERLVVIEKQESNRVASLSLSITSEGTYSGHMTGTFSTSSTRRQREWGKEGHES